jgi:anti-sigma regulatory factor (Ser/Thr protein kinase)
VRATGRTAEERANDDVTVRLPDDASSPRLAREAVRTALARWGLPELFDDVELAVSELVTNAIKHGLPPVILSLRQRAGSMRIAVSDMRPATVTRDLPLPSLDTDESGRGRSIVDAVSDHSGSESTSGDGGGKSVFASWDVDPLTGPS